MCGTPWRPSVGGVNDEYFHIELYEGEIIKFSLLSCDLPSSIRMYSYAARTRFSKEFFISMSHVGTPPVLEEFVHAVIESLKRKKRKEVNFYR